MQTANIATPITAHELHTLAKTASSPTQYKELAVYFHQKEAELRANAAAAQAERDRRAQVNAGLEQKYPRPVDSAQSLYESYLSQANSAALQAQHYDHLAAESQP
jgi:hypothetical protein